MTHDIRWKQRYDNYQRALQTLTRAVALAAERPLSELENQGLIQGFEFTHELAWNVLKDYLESKGFVGLIGSRDATRLAFKNGLIRDGEAWMEMIRARSLSSSTYNPGIAQGLCREIVTRFYPAFVELSQYLSGLSDEPEGLPA